MKRTKRTNRKWSSILIIVLLCGAGAQFIRPHIDHPPVTGDLVVPDELKQILKKDCYDCHSNETKLAWFDRLTPANFLVAAHIREGRKFLNFSNWDSLTRDQQKARLFESLYQAEQNAMPLPQYSLLHRGTKLTAGEIGVFRNYLLSQTPGIRSDTAKARAGALQFQKWIHASSPGSVPAGAANIRPEYNGISFISGFRDWQAVSTTERFDNNTVRAILGNAIAVRAIREQHTNPWPDGAIFAKVAWDQANDSSGIVHTGEFRQVEFMIKDKNKYASSEGWGFARWVRGLDLAPYGKDAAFVTECVNCHRPMKDNDYTFTIPLHPLPVVPADSAGFGPLGGKVISTIINKRNKTMSTLYGNDIAVKAARRRIVHFSPWMDGSHATPYPPGSVLSLVTWQQKEDPHWFGANIPGTVQSVEQLVFAMDGQIGDLPSYTLYEGDPLKKITWNRAESPTTRIGWILDQQASVMP